MLSDWDIRYLKKKIADISDNPTNTSGHQYAIPIFTLFIFSDIYLLLKVRSLPCNNSETQTLNTKQNSENTATIYRTPILD